jgi:hypothetical protein
MEIVFEIITLLIGFGIAITIFMLKGGTLKGFLKMILFFVVTGLTLSIISDQYQIWKDKKNEVKMEQKETMRERLDRISESDNIY